jgi:ribonucleoside-triphosphate reductase
MQNNLEALEEVVKFIYDNIQYAEFNTKSDYCMECGYDGEITLVDGKDGNPEWKCPNCGNMDHHKMSVVRRTCGLKRLNSPR